MLKFIGSGSCFNTALGNNSAYIKEDKNFLLIDCGGDVFNKLLKYNLLKDVDDITVLITHLHSDHVGSLPDLIFFTYFILNKKVKILFPNYSIVRLLELMGVTKQFYELEILHEGSLGDYTIIYNYIISPVIVKHDDRLSGCFGYEIRNDNISYYYSGDSKMIPEYIIKKLENYDIDYFYQDTSSQDYKENIHLSLKQLSELIKPEFQSKIFCMHLDNKFFYADAWNLGFNIVENEFTS